MSSHEQIFSLGFLYMLCSSVSMLAHIRVCISLRVAYDVLRACRKCGLSGHMKSVVLYCYNSGYFTDMDRMK